MENLSTSNQPHRSLFQLNPQGHFAKTELLNNRRSFLHSATALVAGAGLAQNSANAASAHQGPLTKRWTEQRWTLDNTIRAVGMDWDQPRSIPLAMCLQPFSDPILEPMWPNGCCRNFKVKHFQASVGSSPPVVRSTRPLIDTCTNAIKGLSLPLTFFLKP